MRTVRRDVLKLRPESGGRPLHLLGIAAHPDDLEIGCAGSLLQWQRSSWLGESWDCRFVVLTGSSDRVNEARAACDELLGDRQAEPLVALGLRDGYLPAEWATVKERLASLAPATTPDLVLVPGQDDAHQDHRLVGELAWQLYRQSSIWEYEIPKWDGDLRRPNTYVPLDEDVMDEKVALLHRHYASQRSKPWYDEEVFRGLARLRGIECGARYAEAFTVRKMVAA